MFKLNLRFAARMNTNHLRLISKPLPIHFQMNQNGNQLPSAGVMDTSSHAHRKVDDGQFSRQLDSIDIKIDLRGLLSSRVDNPQLGSDSRLRLQFLDL